VIRHSGNIIGNTRTDSRRRKGDKHDQDEKELTKETKRTEPERLEELNLGG
jgi:hypothetical protein